jgi:hypothetical protein
METENNTAQVVADLVKQHHKGEVITLKHPTDEITAPVMLLSSDTGNGIAPVEKFFDAYRERPKHRKGTAVMRDAASFIAHVNRFKSMESALFADPTKGRPGIACVFDYHEAVNRSPAGEDGEFNAVEPAAEADWMQHRARYDFPLSPEWMAWGGANGKWMDQAEFATFIEERNEDIIPNPPTFKESELSAADSRLKDLIDDLDGTLANRRAMMGLSRGLNITATSKVVNVVGLNSGTGAIVFEEDHRTQDSEGKKVDVPSLFLLGIPVFENSPDLYRVVVRLRYRRQGGGIQWKADLYRHDKVFDHACRDVWSEIEKATGLPLFVGAPEA